MPSAALSSFWLSSQTTSCWCPFIWFGTHGVSFWCPEDSTFGAFFFLMNSSYLSLDHLSLAGFILHCLKVLEGAAGVPATFLTHLYLVVMVPILDSKTRLTSSPLVLAARKSLSISITLGGTSCTEFVSSIFRFPKESEITPNILLKSQHLWSGQLVSAFIPWYLILFIKIEFY